MLLAIVDNPLADLPLNRKRPANHASYLSFAPEKLAR